MPTSSIAQVDAVAYVDKTVAVRVTHDQVSGSVTGYVSWGDSATTSFGSWDYTVASKTFTHTYLSAASVTVATKSAGHSTEASKSLTIKPDRPLPMPVDSGRGIEWGRTATPMGNNPNNISPGSVRYADGVVSLSFPDLASSGLGMGWGHSRSFTNGPGYDFGGDNGNGWVETQLPSILQDIDKIIALAIDGTNARTFEDIDTSYKEWFFGTNKIVYDGDLDQYVLTTPDGVVYRFVDFGAAAVQSRGQFISRTDPNGNVTFVNGRNAAGNVTDIRRDDEQWIYDYISGGANDGKLLRVTLKRDDVELRKVEYTYYGTSEDHGNLGDLKTATIKQDGQTISTQYHRYYKPGEADGYTGGLKMYLGLASYDRADATLDPLTATDAELEEYCDFLFKYDTSRRVAFERVQGVGCSMCSAGIGEYTFTYTDSGNSPGFNSWATKTIETLPDGNKNVVYSNVYGQVMLKFAQQVESESVTAEWPTYYRYDGDGRLVFTANTSVFEEYEEELYDEDADDLVASVSNDSPYLQDDAGLVITYAYGGSTTGDDTTPGNVKGYLQEISIKQGEDGVSIKQATYKYFTITEDGLTVHPWAQQIVYRDDNSGDQTTAYAYDYATDSIQIVGVTITYPTVTTAQNGPNSADTQEFVLDDFGQVVWSKDGGGFLTYREYDDFTGAVVYQIADVDTTNTADYEGDAPWTATGGLHLISEWTVDFLGRATSYTSPRAYNWAVPENKPIDYTVYNDAAHEVRFYPAWDTTLNDDDGGPTGPIRIYREDWFGKYTETLTMSAVPDVDGGLPTGTEDIDDLQSLSRTRLNNAGQAIEQDAYFRLDDVTYSTAAVLTGPSSAVRHYATLTDYAFRGGVKRTETPTGTITRYVRDSQNRVIEVWVGTDDTPTTGYWSPSNNDGADMVRVSRTIFDGEGDTPGVGDGNVTRTIQYPGGETPDRVTDNSNDWRNRLVAIKQGVEDTESTDVNRQIFFRVYDNLNHVIESRTYDGDDITITITDGEPIAPTDDLMRSKMSTKFDERGRVYRTHVFEIDPELGDLEGRDLQSDNWYDRRGHLIKMLSPGGLVQKMLIDGVGRVTLRLTSDGGGDPAPGASSNWIHADDATGDIVFEESHTTFDDNGNAILVISKQRFHDTTATGHLGNLSTEPKARLYFAANYFDRANRVTDSVNIGTDGDGGWSRPGTVPSRSATVLINSREYDAAGRVSVTIDPRGLERHNIYDALSRTTKTIENFTGTGEIDNLYPDENKTTEFSYDGMNHLLQYMAWMNETDVQITEYSYGVTEGAGSAINSNDLLAFVTYPDITVSGPQPAQFAYTYNALGQRIGLIDIKGTEHNYSFDVMGRPTADAVVDYENGEIDVSVRRLTTEYNSAGQAFRFTSWDAASEGTIVNQVQREFNGFGQLVKEYQEVAGAVDTATLDVQYTYSTTDNHSRLTKITYPNGRELAYNYSGADDDISRLSSISDGSITLEGYLYLGLGTVVERSHPEAEVELTYIGTGPGEAGDQYVGLDRFGRVIDQLWWDSDEDEAVVHIKYGYDENSNRVYADNKLTAGFDELYEYDGLNQLSQFERGTLSFGPLTISSVTRDQTWTMDGLGNFVEVDSDGVVQARSHDLQNRLNEIVTDGSSTATLAFDDAGNMITDETGRDYLPDAWNRPVQVNEAEHYAYDALNRRVQERDTSLYYSSQWQVIEERVDDTVTFTYAWSPVYVDAMIARDNEVSPERIYSLTDANWNVVAILKTGDRIIERFAYDPYGRFDILREDWSPRGGASDYDWVYLHQGGRWDAAVAMFAFRNRDYSPTLIRWNRMDPIGFGAGDSDLYRYEANMPVSQLDPYGLFTGGLVLPSLGALGPWIIPGIAIGGVFAGGLVAGQWIGNNLGNALGNALYPLAAAATSPSASFIASVALYPVGTVIPWSATIGVQVFFPGFAQTVHLTVGVGASVFVGTGVGIGIGVGGGPDVAPKPDPKPDPKPGPGDNPPPPPPPDDKRHKCCIYSCRRSGRNETVYVEVDAAYVCKDRLGSTCWLFETLPGRCPYW